MPEQSKTKRIYILKRSDYDARTNELWRELVDHVGVRGIKAIRACYRYDIAGLADEDIAKAQKLLFDPVTDSWSGPDFPRGEANWSIGLQALPGQFDQRADSAEQSLGLITGRERPVVQTALFYLFHGDIEETDRDKIKNWLINPVEARLVSEDCAADIDQAQPEPQPIADVAGFRRLTAGELKDFSKTAGLAMSLADLAVIQAYFLKEGREPTWTELRVLDTYWSDHCRHTTFLTKITEVEVADSILGEVYRADWADYLALRRSLYSREQLENKPPCLMDLATLAAKELKSRGLLDDLDESEEVNACSIRVSIPVDGEPVDYLVMFKNETHNHPTEIEPFGGAATCLGGAIRDPLSGRSYVYQAMRVTGSADPRQAVDQTLPGKLSQLKITTTAALGYSSYANQIGLAGGLVDEFYHPGYLAKRMEIGALIGAVPADYVRREQPQPGDLVVLIGGATGRDGCGAATGSSQVHDQSSLTERGSDVQKGDPLTERKIVRLFRDPQVTRLIKRCNDFGAGGVSVAIGELADGLTIDLDRVPVKYPGLNGTELAISESQERMAVVIAKDDLSVLIDKARKENVSAVVVAQVTLDPRMVMTWRGAKIVDLKREFIDSHGAKQSASALLTGPAKDDNWFRKTADEQTVAGSFGNSLLAGLASLSGCSRRALAERFDNSAGGYSVLSPYGGRRQHTPEIGMAAVIPVVSGRTDACSLMSFGFEPDLSAWSPYHGAMYAVMESLARIAALGGTARKARLSFQEYFKRLTNAGDWGLPLAALLGALKAQRDCLVPAIGGKDSMSGTFHDLHVPPTLVSFAVQVSSTDRVLSAAIDRAQRAVYLLPVPLKDNDPKSLLPDCVRFMEQLDLVDQMNAEQLLAAASVVRKNGVAVAVTQMCLGNELGFSFDSVPLDELFRPQPAALLLVPDNKEGAKRLEQIGAHLVGTTRADGQFVYEDQAIDHDSALSAYNDTLAGVFPAKAPDSKPYAGLTASQAALIHPAKPQILKGIKPKILIPVLPGSNGEYEAARHFQNAGGDPLTLVVQNMTAQEIKASVQAVKKALAQSQILMLPSGFSGGDEPGGAGKLLAAFFSDPQLLAELKHFLDVRKGLILGIGNGFQALVRLGFLPDGQYMPAEPDSPRLVINPIGRHLARMVRTKVISNRSPWFNNVTKGSEQVLPISCTEGRFVAPEQVIDRLFANDQVAAGYVDEKGKSATTYEDNPTGSLAAIEAVTSPDGRILGRMAQSDRLGPGLYKNIPHISQTKIFEAGVAWFKG